MLYYPQLDYPRLDLLDRSEMPRKINALAVSAGKLILAIQKEEGEVIGGPDAAAARAVMTRAQTLQHAAHNDCVPALLNGRSLVEYLDAAWVEMHPAVKPSVDAFASELNATR
jgi:hypothetical protein